MSTKKTEANTVTEGMLYKGKTLLRRENLIYYGNTDEKYIIKMTVDESDKIMDLDVSSSVTVVLQTNNIPGQEKELKRAERDGLFEALDLGAYWLEEKLGE